MSGVRLAVRHDRTGGLDGFGSVHVAGFTAYVAQDDRFSYPENVQLSLECQLDASDERVFDLMTTSAPLARWFGPSGFTMPEVEVDLRVGGRYRFTMQPPAGEPFHISGEYVEIEAPGRLVFTFNYEEPAPDDRETTVTIDLDAMDGATELVLRQAEFATEERVELHRGGWTESFEKLRNLLESGG